MKWKVAVISAAAAAGLVAGCGASHESGAVPQTSHPSTAVATTPPPAQTQAYLPDAGDAGTACELLPSAAVNALFGPLQPFDGGDVNNVSLSGGYDINSNPYCIVEWYTAAATNYQWQVTVGAVQPTAAADDSLALYLSNYTAGKIAGGMPGALYGTGNSGTSAAGQTVAVVPMSGGSYLYLAGTFGGTPLAFPVMTKMLRVMVAMAMKYPVSGLKGISSLP
jgi:hypothetical protein